MTLISFIVCLALFLAIGLASFLFSRNTKDDYYLASRDVRPMFVGLSAVATNNSGYMFIGVMGFTYTVGLSAIWLMVGWIVGDFITSLFIHRNLRKKSEAAEEVTFAGALSTWNGTHFKVLRAVIALMTLAFLGAYAAAQLSAGGKALQALTGWPPETGAIIAAFMVAAYCMAGGIRASIWTDVAQSFVMIGAMTLLGIVAIMSAGGLGASLEQLQAVPDFMNWFPADLPFGPFFGPLLFALGWLFAGFCVVGQPHIMVRFMTLDDDKRLAQTRAWYYSFFTIFYALATVVGLMTRIHLPDIGGMDPELVLPTMAIELLPPVLVGLMLAGIFSATMSTADSLVLSCSSALTHDLMPERLEKPIHLKLVTIMITAFALAIALSGNQSVFALVILAWGLLGASFAPLLVLLARRVQVTEPQAIIMVLAGAMTVVAWREAGLHTYIFEGMPGIVAGFIAAGVYRLVAGKPQEEEAAENA